MFAVGKIHIFRQYFPSVTPTTYHTHVNFIKGLRELFGDGKIIFPRRQGFIWALFGLEFLCFFQNLKGFFQQLRIILIGHGKGGVVLGVIEESFVCRWDWRMMKLGRFLFEERCMIRKVYILILSLKGILTLYKRIFQLWHAILHLIVLYFQAVLLLY